jgi:outer membrane protein
MFRTLSLSLALGLSLAVSTLFAQNPAPATPATPAAAPAAAATKYGHMNLGNLLDELPDTKKANDLLTAFGDKLKMKDDSLTKSFQADVQKLQVDYPNLPPVQFEQRKAELQKRQEAIQAFEADAEKQVSARRDELLRPILTRINDAIQAVAKENGYMMIFDTSTGSMLFAADTDDVTALVKKKLGL